MSLFAGMMTRENLEENQVWLYAGALATGAGFGLWQPVWSARLELLISPVLAIMLYGMFVQIPFLQLRQAFVNRRFAGALLTVNFVIVPALVWGLSQFLPEYPPLLLGVYLVLLTPCIDYVIVFTHLGQGNARLVLAATPMLLLIQMLLLPAYLWLFMGGQAARVMSAEPFLQAFLLLIALPLGLALASEIWARRKKSGQAWLVATGWLPVPFMGLTLFLVVASQIDRIGEYLPVVGQAVPLYIAFMAIMPLLARWTAQVYRLDTRAGRALIFSSVTRNSLVVLPLALALPDAWVVTPAVIVTQTLVELVGELVFIRLVPTVILSETRRDDAPCR